MNESVPASPPPSPHPDSARHAEGVRQSALHAAQRVKDMALDLANDLADGYRKSTRHTRMRGAVIAGWVLVSALFIGVAWPPGETANDLRANVLLSDGFLGDKLVIVWNDSGEPWTDVTVTLDGKWEWKTSVVAAGEKRSVRPEEFTDYGTPAPHDLTPRSATIQCRQGSVNVGLGSQGIP